MAKATGNKSFVKEEDDKSPARKRWWNSSEADVGKDLSTYCASLETAQQRDRYLGMVFEQLATGRAAQSYGLSMAGRVKGDMATALFSPPSENYVAIAADVFANKIGKNQPFLEWIPVAASDYKTKAGCKQATEYVDKLFADTDTWPMVEQAFKDAFIHGTGVVKVGGSPGRVTLTRIQDDEVLLDPTAGDNPRNFQFRVFLDRETCLELYGDTDEKREKIEAENGCHQGFYALDIGYDDTLALCEGYYLALPDTDKPGRHVVCIGETVLLDEPWTDDLPFAKLPFEPVANSWKGQGGVEQQLPLQREVDRLADNLAEQERRFSWCKVQIRRADNIDPDSLTDNSIVEYNEKPALFEQGVAPTKELYNQLEKKGQQCLLRVGISGAQAQGETPGGIDSGVAILANQQIDDVRHVAVAQRLERFVEQLGKLIIQAAAKYKPAVYSRGRKIPWPEVAMDQHKAKCRAFRMSGLPQSIPGRKQALADMLRNGEIDKVEDRRAIGTDDVVQVSDAITAGEDLAEFQLDTMVETGKFQPPVKFQDMQRALAMAQTRIMQEMKNGLAEDRIQLLARYAAQLEERMSESVPAAPAGPMQPGPVAPPMDPNMPVPPMPQDAVGPAGPVALPGAPPVPPVNAQ